MLEKYLRKNCRGCGAPKIVSRIYRWGNDGTMGVQFRKNRRMVFVNACFYDNLVEEINNKLGISIWPIVYEYVVNTGRASLEDLFEAGFILGKIKRYAGIRKMIIHYFHEMSALMGFCYSKTVEPTSEDVRSAYVKNPFNLYITAGAIVSAFEALDQMAFNYQWEHISGSEHIINIRPGFGELQVSEYFDHTLPAITEEKLNLKRCPVCGIPKRVSEVFEWRLEDGLLLHRKSQERFCAFASTILSPVFKEISEEWDIDMTETLVDIQCRWTVAHLGRIGIIPVDSVINKRDANLAFRRFVGDLPIYGYGNPVALNIDEGFYSVTVENPFFTEMIAGILLGLYKGLFLKEAEIEWESPDENKIVYTIRSD